HIAAQHSRKLLGALGEFPLMSFCAVFVLEKCGRKKDNGYDFNEVCKGRVFLASEKFNPVRECGSGFRKNLNHE
ncbi:MAG: hypothetical protein IJQ73_12425, partial [Kiritimatiellae bacterium]|nr:hypothetical protein [Kiritimatiellia bacterium]